ncbi:MAG: MBL fold metallo-hydrolase [Chitinophagaceae bacterium]|nr:MAG: MBL fold metallo-hydrolase [Chitinophagaceae bacterium]
MRAPQPETNEITSIKVRMYAHGFGDCFVLFYQSDTKVEYKMVIDCGMLTGDTERLRNVIRDITKDCGGYVDVVVQTHEHKDHVSGFNLKDKDGSLLWDQIDVGETWLAWTENTGPEGDKLAQQLKDKHKKKLSGLVKALSRYESHIHSPTHVKAMRETYTGETYMAAQNRYAAAMRNVLEFAGIEGSDIQPDFRMDSNGLGLTVKEAMNYFTDRNQRIRDEGIRTKSGKSLQESEITYWEPGDLADRACTGLKGINIYFFGPPKNYDRLKQMEDKTHVEMYVTDMGLSQNFYMALDATETEQKSLSPFSKKYFFDESELSDKDRKNDDCFWNLYHDQKNYWREINTDWINNAGALALALDSYTNNTSLVMGIEFTRSKKVLMFVADAQIGNWISWTEPESETSSEPKLKWQIQESDKTITVTARDLLQRTVFYKVGHHASHNATARANGLELMISPELAAMIPVDNKVAGRQGKKGWKMPAEDLYKRLIEKTKGRIIRLDTGNLLENDTEEIPDGAKPTEKMRLEFNSRVGKSAKTIMSDDDEPRALYWEYTVSDK